MRSEGMNRARQDQHGAVGHGVACSSTCLPAALGKDEQRAVQRVNPRDAKSGAASLAAGKHGRDGHSARGRALCQWRHALAHAERGGDDCQQHPPASPACHGHAHGWKGGVWCWWWYERVAVLRTAMCINSEVKFYHKSAKNPQNKGIV